MPMERHEKCLENVSRRRKKEKVKLIFMKHRKGMLKQKVQRMEYP